MDNKIKFSKHLVKLEPDNEKGVVIILILIGLLLITGLSLYYALRQKKPFFLALPFISIFVYFLVQIIIVPTPFFETVKFILSLN